MSHFNPSWNWDLIIFLYTIFMVSGGYWIGSTIRKSIHEGQLFNEYAKEEELRAIINGLLNEIDGSIADINKAG